MKKYLKIIGVILLIVIVNIGVFFMQKNKEGVHDFYFLRFYNINSPAYIYDPKTDEISGAKNLKIDGMINKIAETYHGIVEVEGNELEGNAFSDSLEGASVSFIDNKNYFKLDYLSFIQMDSSHPAEMNQQLYMLFMMDKEVICFVYDTEISNSPLFTLIYSDSEESAKACYQEYKEMNFYES